MQLLQKLILTYPDLEQVFAVKVNEKKKKLLDAEQDFNREYDDTMEMLAKTRKEIEVRRKKFVEERDQLYDSTDMGTPDPARKDKKKHKIF